MDQFEEHDLANFLKDRLGITILRFDAHYLEIGLTLNGQVIGTASADVPAYEIRTGGDD